MPPVDIERELQEIKRRLDLAETRLSQTDGHFEFISGQLRDIQLYLHARFADMDERFSRFDAQFAKVNHRLDGHDSRFDRLEGKIDALPRAVAELIVRRG